MENGNTYATKTTNFHKELTVFKTRSPNILEEKTSNIYLQTKLIKRSSLLGQENAQICAKSEPEQINQFFKTEKERLLPNPKDKKMKENMTI